MFAIQLLESELQNNHKRLWSKTIVLLLFIVSYALFALDRIKKFTFWRISGTPTTNEIWIILFVFLLHLLPSWRRSKKQPRNKGNLYVAACLYAILLVALVGGFSAKSSQYLYAGLLFFVPSVLFFVASSFETWEANRFMQMLVVLCLVYSIFALVLVMNYAFFMKLIGNPIDYRYYGQYRASMMLGSSITVSYYFNLTLPLCFHLYYSSNERRWRRIAGCTAMANVAATFALLSRAASAVASSIVFFYVLSRVKTRRELRRKAGLLVLLIMGFLFVANMYDLSRLSFPLSTTDASFAARAEATSLGLLIFQKRPFFGSGLGRYFERVYQERFITVDGVTGLIDPHNMYVLVLSELGVFGFAAVIGLFIALTKSFMQIRAKSLRQTALASLLAFLIGALGGSHLFNEISFASLFWTYMGMFCAFSGKPSRRASTSDKSSAHLALRHRN